MKCPTCNGTGIVKPKYSARELLGQTISRTMDKEREMDRIAVCGDSKNSADKWQGFFQQVREAIKNENNLHFDGR
jgi:hypothetical protein